MIKTLATLFAFIGIAFSTIAQSAEEGMKFLYYEKNKSATETLQKVVASKPKDGYSIYWLGQALIANDNVAGAKALYQKALQDGVNDPWILVGMGHVELLENGDKNSAKQKFEQAITATKGKKGNENPGILNAIGRANADGNSQQGDPQYGIEKLKRAVQLDPKNLDALINLGVCYLKLGTEHGGEAVEAFRSAAAINPQYAAAYYRMGKVYQSQNNKESMDEQFGKAISADPAFAPVYIAYFLYYQERDVNVAKEYLDKYVQYADKDCTTDYFVADYLFRAGKYQESLAKTKEMEGGACSTFPRINVLYAYDYERLGDSLQAKSYIEKFFASNPANVEPTDYVFAGQLLAKFPGSGATASTYLEKAIMLDTIKANKVEYMNTLADIYAKDSMFDKQYGVYQNLIALKGGTPSEADYYKLSKSATDSKNCTLADSITKAYVAAFPDKPQGYSFNVRAAKLCDADTSKGLAVEPIRVYNDFLAKDTANNKTIFQNDYYLLLYYNDHAKDVNKAMEVLDHMLTLYPEAGEEHDFAINTRKLLQQSNKKSGSDKPGGGK